MRAGLRSLVLRAALLIASVAGGTATAANYDYSFTDSSTTPPTPVSAGFATLDQLIGSMQTFQNTTFNVNLRGIAAQISTVDSAQPIVSLQIPSLGVSQSFLGQSLGESFELLKRFLTEGDNAARIQREQVRTSPFDPVAGNPSSLMARVVALDYDQAFAPVVMDVAEGTPPAPAPATGGAGGASASASRRSAGAGILYGHFRDQGLKTNTVTLPLSMTFRSDLDPRRQFTIRLPVTMSDVNGARAWSGTLGASLRLPVSRPWALTASLGYAIADSADLGARAEIVSASVTSTYLFRPAFGDLMVGNMVGYYRTIRTSFGGVVSDPGIANTVFRNGILFSHATPSWMIGRSVEYTLVNTYYTGTDLYLRTYTEAGIGVGSNRRADSARSYLRGALLYLYSSKTKGVRASAEYWF